MVVQFGQVIHHLKALGQLILIIAVLGMFTELTLQYHHPKQKVYALVAQLWQQYPEHKHTQIQFQSNCIRIYHWTFFSSLQSAFT